jgi:hypothetical protein
VRIVHSADELPRSTSDELRQALRIAFVAHTFGEPGEDHPALLLRLVRRGGSEDLGVGIKHLGHPHDDTIEAIGNVQPENLLNRRPGDQHVGAIAVSDYARIRDGEQPHPVGLGRMLVGVMLSRWTFQMTWRRAGEQPACMVASPVEFGLLGSDLTMAVATLNERFHNAQ